MIANTYDAIRTKISFTVNDLNLRKRLDYVGLSNDVTLGLYVSSYSYSHSEYQMGVLEDVKNNPDGLNIVALNASGAVVGSVTENGILTYGSGADGSLSGVAVAPYAADTLHITPRWQVDAGVRYETRDQFGYQGVTAGQNVDPSGPLAARAVTGVVSYRHHKEDLTGVNYTFGTAYDLFSNLNGFVRYTHAYSMPQFTTIITGAVLPNGSPVPVSTINQAEGGLKFKSSTFQAAITAFYSHFNELSASSQVVDPTSGAVTTSNVLLNSTTVGRWRGRLASGPLVRPFGDLHRPEPQGRLRHHPDGPVGSDLPERHHPARSKVQFQHRTDLSLRLRQVERSGLCGRIHHRPALPGLLQLQHPAGLYDAGPWRNPEPRRA